MAPVRFPDGFLWGAASSAYQIEGSPLADGAGPTTWHEFSHTPGRIKDGTNGDLACDSYNRCAEDIRLVKELGLKAYRFSVGWGRLFPEQGTFNQKAMDYYERLVDGLLAAGIEPWVTIFHLEEPLWLARQGGFVRRSGADRLVELGTALFQRLGDRVASWITVNEPTVFAFEGYGLGEFPPGRKLALRPMMHCLHHLLLAHARLCEAWSATGRKQWIGLAHNYMSIAPANQENRRDIEAAKRMDGLVNGTVLDPLLKGTFPEIVASHLGAFLPRSLEKDLGLLRTPGTFFGINYYSRSWYRWSWLFPFLHAVEHFDPQQPRSAMWPIYPPGIHEALIRLRDEYGNPTAFVTENGYPLVETAGKPLLDDDERIAYLRECIAMVAKAIAEGVDCRGYFHWSLMDNFEWNWGLAMRFGLLRTDFATQRRQWKKSAYWYSELARTNSLD